MRQRFRLDRPGRLTYLALLGLSCRPAVPVLLPETAVPVSAEQVKAWVDSTQPQQSTLHRFKWLFQDDRSSTGGRGSARIAVPDSMRFDVAGPLGVGKASAVIIGDSARWVEPEKSVQDLVPNYPLLWALFGVARMPDSGATFRGAADGHRAAWQYALGTDTIEYLRTTGSPTKLLTEVRHGGKVLGRAETTFASDGRPIKSRLLIPSAPARLDVTFFSSAPTSAFPAEIWQRPGQRP